MSDINHSIMIPLHIADQAVANCEKEIAGLKAENARLKAEVERLRKAGDAMQKRLIFLHDRWDSDEPNVESDAWYAAKEAKQS